MNQERVRRKLSAILRADVVGYSRLMGEDEVSIVRTLESYRRVMSDLIEQFSGRAVDSRGDNLALEGKDHLLVTLPLRIPVACTTLDGKSVEENRKGKEAMLLMYIFENILS